MVTVSCLDIRDADSNIDGDAGGMGDSKDRDACFQCHHSGDTDDLASCDTCHSFPPSSAGHPAHLNAGPVEDTTACSLCHKVPTRWFDEGHIDAVVQVVFSKDSLARLGGSEPTWDGQSCKGVYCHGATLSGGSNTEAVWDGTTASQCGSCHGIPPGDGHASSSNCILCHGSAYLSEDELDPERHINGAIDLAK